MNLLRKSAAVAVTALALSTLPSGAQAHDGSHPFQNCSEAYKNGYANISKGDEHYAARLDRDKDGVGCDQPPSGFVPAEDDDAKDSGTGGSSQEESAKGGGSKDDTELAETGGDDTTPYLAGGGAAVLLAGGGLLIVARRRRATR